jgi:hypothetical protein
MFSENNIGLLSNAREGVGSEAEMTNSELIKVDMQSADYG